MRIYTALLALMLVAPPSLIRTRVGSTHDATIVRRGNFVIAAVTVPPMICYGTYVPRGVACKPAIARPTWREIE
jgi:hypothetical protein